MRFVVRRGSGGSETFTVTAVAGAEGNHQQPTAEQASAQAPNDMLH